MKQITLKATELTETNVQIVSMVKRGANRIPYRIVKEDTDTMLDLGKIAAKGFQKSDNKKGGVLAVIISKSADIDAITTLLADTGLKLDKGEERAEDGVVIFKQDGVDEFDVGMVKLDDDVMVAISGLQKGFSGYNWQDTDFASVFATEGFYPSLRMATDAMETTISNILYKEESKPEMKSKVSKALTDFGSMVNLLVDNIPESAIKADDLLKSEDYLAKKADKAKAPPVAEDAPVEDDKSKTKAKKEDEKVDLNGDGTTAVKTEEPTETVKTEDDKEDKVEKTDDDLLSKLGPLISKGITDALAPVTQSIEALKTDLGKVNTRVEEVATTAQKADKALKTTVIASSSPDRTVTKKSDSEAKVPPPLDTAFTKNV